MTTAQAMYPNYAAPLTPRPRPPSKDLTLIAADSAEQFSGLFAKGAALAWGFRYLATDAEALAVELITRAVETTGNPNPHPRFTELSKNRSPNIGIRITQRDHGLLIEVWDSDPTPPQDADAHLTIMANVSQNWGCYALDIAEIYVQLTEHSRAGEFRVAAFVTEPASWWKYSDFYLRPDAYTALATSTYQDVWWLEIDRDTESAPRLRDVLRDYRDHAESGGTGPDGVLPRILITTPRPAASSGHRQHHGGTDQRHRADHCHDTYRCGKVSDRGADQHLEVVRRRTTSGRMGGGNNRWGSRRHSGSTS